MNAASLVPEDLLEAIEPLFPEAPPKPTGANPPVPDRAALGGTFFVLRIRYLGDGCPKNSAVAAGHLLAAFARLAASRGLAEVAWATAESVGRWGRHQLEAGQRR